MKKIRQIICILSIVAMCCLMASCNTDTQADGSSAVGSSSKSNSASSDIGDSSSGSTSSSVNPDEGKLPADMARNTALTSTSTAGTPRVGTPTEGFTLTADDKYQIAPKKVYEYMEKARSVYTPNNYETVAVDDEFFNQKDIKATGVNITFNYTGIKESTKTEILVSKVSNLSDPFIYDATGQSSSTLYNLETGVKYYCQVCATINGKKVYSNVKTFTTVEGPRFFRFSGIGNFRDIGYWKDANGNSMKQGLVYRSAKLDKGTQSDIDILLNNLKIKTELDLRSGTEAKDGSQNKSELTDKFNFILIPASSYVKSVKSDITIDVMRVFADYDNYPILFHCAAGADRTGTIAFYLEGLCGVDEISMNMDYEFTGSMSRSSYPDDNESGLRNLVKAVKGFEGDTIQEKLYNNFLMRGMTKMELSNIYNILMTDSAIFTSNSLSSKAITENGKYLEFSINPRSSSSVTSITVDGKKVEFTVKNNVITAGKIGTTGTGVITFNDGATLEFAY